jgi:estrone sulfotransferase
LQGVEPDNFEKLERPRVFKTHNPIHLLPPQITSKNPRMIFISRDVKDVAVSNFHFRKNVLHEKMGTIEEHFDEFIKDQVFFGPYREYLKNFTALKDQPNFLFLTYEGVTSDFEGSIKKVAKFLGKQASDENVKKLAAHLDFKAMKSE